MALLSLLLNTARIKELRTAIVQARRTSQISGCPVKIEEPVNVVWRAGEVEDSVLTRGVEEIHAGGFRLLDRVIGEVPSCFLYGLRVLSACREHHWD